MSLLGVLEASVPSFDPANLVSLIIVTDGFDRTVETVRGIVMHKCDEPTGEPFVCLFGNDFTQKLQEIESVPEYMIDRTCSLEQAKQSADAWLYNKLGDTKPIFVSSGFYGWTDDLLSAMNWRKGCDAVDLRQLYSAYIASDQLCLTIAKDKIRDLLAACKKPPQRFGLKAIEGVINADYISIGIGPVVRAYNTSAQTLKILTEGE